MKVAYAGLEPSAVSGSVPSFRCISPVSIIPANLMFSFPDITRGLVSIHIFCKLHSAEPGGRSCGLRTATGR